MSQNGTHRKWNGRDELRIVSGALQSCVGNSLHRCQSVGPFLYPQRVIDWRLDRRRNSAALGCRRRRCLRK